MGRSYSSDLRIRIYGEIEQGGSRRRAGGTLAPHAGLLIGWVELREPSSPPPGVRSGPTTKNR